MQKLEETFTMRKDKKRSYELKIAALEKRVSECTAAAQKAATEGNVTEYKKFKGQSEDADAELYVTRATAQKVLEPIPRSEVQAAWDEYETDLERQIRAAGDEIKRARGDLAKAYQKKMDLFADACRTRQRLGEIMELQYNPRDIDRPEALGTFHIPFELQGDYDPEYSYFSELGDLDEDTLNKYDAVFSMHRVD